MNPATQRKSATFRSSSMGLICVLALSHSLLGCKRNADGTIDPIDPPPPEFVYIPESHLEVRVHIQVPAKIKKGEPVRLRARRETLGNWQRVRHAELPSEALWYAQPPPSNEPEVAANLTWQTDPPFAAQFDVGLRSMSLGMEREATFKTAGIFKVWALSATPILTQSNVVVVEVSDVR
jgi:hypothetical protein